MALKSQGGRVRWSVSISSDLDAQARMFLRHHDNKKGALSKLVERAVGEYIDKVFAEEGRRELAKSGVTEKDLEDILDKALGIK